MEEVETPEQETSITRVTAEKNPRKVSAGKKGAEARRRKQEHILQELRSEKEKLRGSSPSPERKSKPRSVATKQEPPPPASQSVYIGVGLTIAAVATVALVYYSKKKSTPPEIPQLKTRRRSLHME